MAEIMLEQNLEGFSEDPEALAEAVVKMQKSLSWLLAHLDSQNVQSINTNITKVASEDGATTLNGAQILMYDGKGRLRAALGQSKGGSFLFEIYDTEGDAAVHFNEDGHAVFSGNIEGANIRIAPNAFRDYIALENDGREDTIGLYYAGTRIGGIRLLAEVYILEEPMAAAIGAGLDVDSSTACMIADIGGGSVEIASGASGTFEANGKTVTVRKGIITHIG